MRRVLHGAVLMALALSLVSPLAAQEASPTPTPTPTPELTPTPSPTVSPTPSASPSASPSVPPKKAKVFDAACMQTAVGKRDTAILTAFNTFAAAAKSALETRRSALQEAWGKTNAKERRAAIKAAWSVYRKAIRGARQQLAKDRQAAWKQFRQDAKACRPNSADLGAESGGEGADASL